MDASALIQRELAGQKRTSSGYWPPELAAAIIAEQQGGAKTEVTADKVIDMWQFGCLLYVLCTGYSLLTMDNQ